MSGVREWNMLLSEMIDVALWFYGFTAGLERTQQQCKSGMTLVSAHALCLDLLSYVWLLISE